MTQELGWITEQLRELAVEVDGLHLDPANARLHSERNLQAIASSLNRFGQRKPIVVQRETRTVIAGNGTLEAARSLGWSHVAAVFVDDDPSTATGYAIADNRTAELAEWDPKVLQQLLETVGDIPATELGFNEEELKSLLEATGMPSAGEVEFPEFGEDAANDVKNVTCPECGHDFPV